MPQERTRNGKPPGHGQPGWAGADGESRPAGGASPDNQPDELYARAQAARAQSQLLVSQFRETQRTTTELVQRMRAARDRAEQIRQLWLAPRPGQLRYAAAARLQARLAALPVIEQAKGIIMAQMGWPEDQAFGALHRAAQQENINLRDLAATIVAQTAASGQPQKDRPAAAGAPAQREAARKAVAAIAGAAAHSHPRTAAR